ncbi:MAG TPA: hypothetical protein VFU02_21195 [Polyangiaceae bacterium]|nr:hypothetical protein [Polyangiaceae bacterium]
MHLMHFLALAANPAGAGTRWFVLQHSVLRAIDIARRGGSGAYLAASRLCHLA